MEIEPVRADISQVIRAKDGQMIEIESDVNNVAADLAALDHHFRVRWSEAGEYFVVYWRPDGSDLGDGYLVTTAQELDQRVVKLVSEIHYKVRNDVNYSLSEEIEANHDKADAERDRLFTERAGEHYERLAHALRKDRGVQNRIYVP